MTTTKRATERLRHHQLTCECGHRERYRVDTMDLPGGLRRLCHGCGEVRVLTCEHIHPDEPRLVTCEACGSWVGDPDADRCTECGAFL